MAIIYATLAHEDGGEVEFIYPKTLAELVEYDTVDTVKSKIEKIDTDIVKVNSRVSTVSKNVQNNFTDFSVCNDEVIDIRTPSYNVVAEGTTYDLAGDAIRGQFDKVIELINDIEKALNVINNWSSGNSSDNPIAIHNVDTTAHSDIRKLISTLQSTVSSIQTTVNNIQLATKEDIEEILEILPV